MTYFKRLIIASILLAGSIGPAFSSSMIEIPAGLFVIGDSADPDAAPKRVAMLGSYLIDQYEITNAEFAAQFPNHEFPPGAGRHPVTSVSWDEAKAFCEARDKRLPTGAEWEKAARGANGFTFPWGNKKPRKKPHPFYSGVVKRKTGFNKIDVSVYGVHDMAGSVWEWTQDDRGGKKTVRGGLWNLHLDYEYSKTYERNFIPRGERLIFLGFRCARSNG